MKYTAKIAIPTRTPNAAPRSRPLAEGGLRKQIDEWQARLLTLSAEAERAIDYDEGDFAADPALTRDCSALAAELREWLERPRIEPVAVVG